MFDPVDMTGQAMQWQMHGPQGESADRDQRCVEVARRDGIDVDTVLSPLGAQGPCQLHHCSFAGIVCRLLLGMRDKDACHAGSIDDLAIVLREHVLGLSL